MKSGLTSHLDSKIGELENELSKVNTQQKKLQDITKATSDDEKKIEKQL
tara:strand:+ start:658 stop:804 length:147 start_codon:yes stop_codon:yes gene_type:complete